MHGDAVAPEDVENRHVLAGLESLLPAYRLGHRRGVAEIVAVVVVAGGREQAGRRRGSEACALAKI
jgi:hypothetical protein